MQSRRENYLDELVKSFIEWCIKYRALPQADYEIEWADMLASSDADRVAIAKEMTLTNKTAFDSAMPPIYPTEEIQEFAGVEVMETEIPIETDLTDEDIED